MKNAIVLVLPLLLSVPCLAQPGAPDLTFGANGTRIVDFSPSHDKELLMDLSTTANGEIVLGGLFYEYTAYGAARLTAEGRKDSTFNEDGIFFTEDYFAPIYVAAAVAVQPDRKVIIGGTELGIDEPAPDRVWLKRLKANGHPDLTFGQASVVLTDVTPFNDYAEDVKILPDGKILVAATIDSDEEEYQTPPAMAVLRYLPNGNLDSSFGVAGVARIQTPGWPGRYIAQHLAIYPDGKIVVQGLRRISANPSWQFTVVARLLPDGQMDPSFDYGNGFKVYSISPFHMEDVAQINPLDNGKLLLIGSWRNFEWEDVYFIARLEANGGPDYTFSDSGLKEFKINATSVDYFTAQDAVLQPDGKLIVYAQGYPNQMLIARHLPNGDLDPSFGVEGYRSYAIPGLEGSMHIALQPGGKIVACAWVNDYSQVWRFQNDLSDVNTLVDPDSLSIRVYPNPATEMAWFDFGKAVRGTLSLYNLEGICVRNMVVNEAQTINTQTTGLPAGLYFWQWSGQNENTHAMGKLVVKGKKE